jgi:hypothetical protein
LNVGEPVWLIVVLGGLHDSVEKNEENDEPVKRLRLDQKPQAFSISSIPATKRFTKNFCQK